MVQERFLQRIEYQGTISTLLSQVCNDYNIGALRAHRISEMGYEDLNIAIETNQGSYFAKIFGSFRGKEGAKRYLQTMEKAIKAAVSHPFLYTSPQGHLHRLHTNGKTTAMVLMEYIDGGTLLELGRKPTDEDKKEIVKQAALINDMDYKPSFVYDSWSIVNLLEEFKKKRVALSDEDNTVIRFVVEQVRSIDLSSLPHAFVHGDIRSSNTMKNKEGKLFIIDFAVSNWYPRIVELAVLASELFFDPDSVEKTNENFQWLLAEYQKYHRLTPEEFTALPVLVGAAHAMNVLGASYEVFQGNALGENNAWFALGKKGLDSIKVKTPRPRKEKRKILEGTSLLS